MKFIAFLLFGFILFCCVSVLDCLLTRIMKRLQARNKQKEISVDVCEIMDEE